MFEDTTRRLFRSARAERLGSSSPPRSQAPFDEHQRPRSSLWPGFPRTPRAASRNPRWPQRPLAEPQSACDTRWDLPAARCRAKLSKPSSPSSLCVIVPVRLRRGPPRFRRVPSNFGPRSTPFKKPQNPRSRPDRFALERYVPRQCPPNPERVFAGSFRQHNSLYPLPPLPFRFHPSLTLTARRDSRWMRRLDTLPGGIRGHRRCHTLRGAVPPNKWAGQTPPKISPLRPTSCGPALPIKDKAPQKKPLLSLRSRLFKGSANRIDGAGPLKKNEMAPPPKITSRPCPHPPPPLHVLFAKR